MEGNGNSRNSSAASDDDEELNSWRHLLYFSLLFGVPVLVLHLYMSITMTTSMSSSSSSPSSSSSSGFLSHSVPILCHGAGINYGQAAMVSLVIPLIVVVGGKYFKSAFQSAMHGSFGMDFLVMTGTSVTFFYSIFELLSSCYQREPTRHVFFETSGMLLMFVTIGKYIEAYAKGKSAKAITTLLKLQPKKVTIVMIYKM